MSNQSVSSHIFPVSAAMAGVCITVVSIVRLLEVSQNVRTIIDSIVAFDGCVFLVSGLLSYSALRSGQRQDSLERAADVVFLCGFVVMVATSFMLALELG